MRTATEKAGLLKEKRAQLNRMLSNDVDNFQTSFPFRAPTCFPPLKIELGIGAKALKVQPRKYTRDQKDFLKKFCEQS